MNLRPRTLLTLGFLIFVASCAGSPGGGGGTPADRPTNLSARASGSDLVLEWTGVAGSTGYNLYGSSSAGVPIDPSSRLGSVQATSATLAGLQAGQTAFFAVTALRPDGESPPSNEVSFTVGGGGGGGGTGPDPLLAEQWHLSNVGQGGGTPGEDARVAHAWDLGASGNGVLIAVVDDGLEIGHEDLAANVVPGLSIDYVDGDSDPTGGEHGTAVAGVAASVRDNGVGGAGAAFQASLVGYNFLQNTTSANEADAMTRNAAQVWVSNNSWGPLGGGSPVSSSQSWRQAVESGLDNGRGGRGTVYLFAAGNSALSPNGFPQDNANYDGYANFYGVIAVGAVGDDGVRAFYSEPGANLLVCAPSEGRGGHAITTADRSGSEGYNPPQQGGGGDYSDLNYTATFNGTSSATPLAAGVAALVLEANPDLGWRDVRKVLALSARRNDPGNPGWTTNGAGHAVNHEYGFGVVDAEAAVQLARQWQNLPELVVAQSVPAQPGLPIPDDDPNGVSDQVTLSGTGIRSLEFVLVLFDSSDHSWSADLSIELVSPSGTVSVLAEPHDVPQQAQPPAPFQSFLFSTTRCLDEPADGTWTLRVADHFAPDTGTFNSWRVVVAGT